MKSAALGPAILAGFLVCGCGGVLIDGSESEVTWDGPAVLTVVVSPEEGGSVVADPPGDTYADATRVALQATPAPGFRFDHWSGGLESFANPGELIVDRDTTVTAVFGAAVWTVVIHMSADNELEPNAMEDLNELEAGDLDDGRVAVLALVDRSPLHDTSDGDWTDTRLYRIRPDPSGVNTTLVSEWLPLPDLNLETGSPTELNTGDPSVLSALLSYAEREYPAEHLVAVIWGHGSGWRALPAPQAAPSRTRAAGFDDTSDGDPLYTGELASALEGHSVEILGLDVCLGSMVEVAYELRHGALVLVGSEEMTPPDGWQYDRLLDLLAAGDEDQSTWLDAVVDSYAERYANAAGTTIAAVDLTRVTAVSAALDSLSDTLYDAVEAPEDRTSLRQTLFNDVEDFYATPGDLNLDLKDLAACVRDTWSWADSEAQVLIEALQAAVLREWHHPLGNPRAGGLAVHFVPLGAAGTPVSHDDAYVRGRVVPWPLEFVIDSHWVPDIEGESGLLFRLWYEG